MLSKARTRLLVAAVSASALALVAVPGVGAEVATTSDAAGDAYKTAIAKAKEKRAAKLKACAGKPKAKRAACRKAANKGFATAKAKAEDKRDDARRDAMTPEEKAEQRRDENKEKKDCLRKTRDKSECL